MEFHHLINVTRCVHSALEETPTEAYFHEFYNLVHTALSRKVNYVTFPTPPSDSHAAIMHPYTKSRFIIEHHPMLLHVPLHSPTTPLYTLLLVLSRKE
ncbi:hypothetical protein Trydic_g14867 [Trypoxylus dichotomus]